MRTLLAFLLFLPGWAMAQQEALSLEACVRAAREAHPLSRQAALVQQQGQLQDLQSTLQWRPSMALNAQGTYQSDVITFPENSPLGNLPSLPQAQYRATLDLRQPLYDGGAIRAGKLANAIDRQLTDQEAALSLDQVERQVTELYFSILEADAQALALSASQATLREKRASLESGVRNGILLPADVATLDQEVLRLEQQIDQLRGQASALREVLAVQNGFDPAAPLVLPGQEADQSARAELAMFDLRKARLDAQSELLATQLQPKLAAFASGGIGQPNPYNFLKVDPSGFYLAGISFAWTPFDWGMTKQKQQQLRLQQEMVDLQREGFDLQQEAELARIDRQIQTMASLRLQDDQLIALQEIVVERASSQQSNGTITTTDYLREVQLLTHYRLSKDLRLIQLRRLEAQRNLVH